MTQVERLTQQRDRLLKINIEEAVFHALKDSRCPACEVMDEDDNAPYQSIATIVYERLKPVLEKLVQGETTTHGEEKP